MPFKPGESGNPAGRPEGTKNKNAMRPVLWWNWFEEEVQQIPSVGDRINQIRWAIEQMMPKVPSLPASPDDSVNNVRALLNDIEPATPSVPDGAEPLNGNGSSSTHS